MGLHAYAERFSSCHRMQELNQLSAWGARVMLSLGETQEFSSSLWCQSVPFANKFPSTCLDGEFREVSCKLRIWNRLNQNVSEVKVKDVLINILVLPTWKNTWSRVLSSALFTSILFLAEGKACGVCGSWLFQYRIFHAPYKNVTGLIQKYFYWCLNWWVYKRL